MSGKGTLRVHVLRATNLQDADKVAGGASDGFVVASVAGQKNQTTVINSNLNPVWNQTLTFQVPIDAQGVSTEQLLVELFDKDVIGKDSLGKGQLSLANLQQGRRTEEVITLTGTGKLYLELEAADFGRRPTGAPPAAPPQTAARPPTAANATPAGPSAGAGAGRPPQRGTLRVKVLKATNLADADKVAGGSSDPFVMLSITGRTEKKTTRVINSNLNPVWNEEFTFENVDSTNVLEVTVYDKDVVGKDALGNGTIPCGGLQRGRPRQHLLKIGPNGALYLQLEAVDFDSAPLAGSDFDGTLRITVLQALDLKDVDKVGKSDPFVTLKLGQQRAQTTVKNAELNPAWNEQFEFRVDAQQPRHVVELNVMDKDIVGQDSLGQGQISVEGLARGRPQEYTVRLDANGRLFVRAEAVDFDMPGSNRPPATQQPQQPATGRPNTPPQTYGAPQTYGSPQQPPYNPQSQYGSQQQPQTQYGSPSNTAGASRGAESVVVRVINATELRDTDIIGKCDPYVSLVVGREKRMTAVKKGTINPVWNEEFIFNVPGGQGRLDLEVKDSDIGRDDVLGQASLPLNPGTLGPIPQKFCVPLKNNGRLNIEIAPVNASGGGSRPSTGAASSSGYGSSGSPQQTNGYSPSSGRTSPVGGDNGGKLRVRVLRAQNLPAVDGRGKKADPYVSVAVGRNKQKTTVRKQDMNPVWNEEFTFDVPPGPQTLDIELKDKDVLLDDAIAKAKIPIDLTGVAPLVIPVKGGGQLFLEVGPDNWPQQHQQQGYGQQQGGYNSSGGYGTAHTPGPNSYSSQPPSLSPGSSGARGALRVRVVQAADLKDTDMFGTSDPYVQLTFGREQRKTTVKKGDIHPVWNEDFVFPIQSSGSPQNLTVEVKDKDVIGRDETLGRASLPVDVSDIGRVPRRHVLPLTGSNGRIVLEISGDGVQGGSPTHGGAGQQQQYPYPVLATPYNPYPEPYGQQQQQQGYGHDRQGQGQGQGGAVKVRVVEAFDLKDADVIGGKSDGYVVLSLAGQNHRTSTKKGDNNPLWDEEFTIQLPSGGTFPLEVEVKDKDVLGRDDSLGRGVIPVSINELPPSGPRQEVVPLQGNGRLYLEISRAHDAHPPNQWAQGGHQQQQHPYGQSTPYPPQGQQHATPYGSSSAGYGTPYSPTSASGRTSPFGQQQSHQANPMDAPYQVGSAVFNAARDFGPEDQRGSAEASVAIARATLQALEDAHRRSYPDPYTPEARDSMFRLQQFRSQLQDLELTARRQRMSRDLAQRNAAGSNPASGRYASPAAAPSSVGYSPARPTSPTYGRAPSYAASPAASSRFDAQRPSSPPASYRTSSPTPTGRYGAPPPSSAQRYSSPASTRVGSLPQVGRYGSPASTGGGHLAARPSSPTSAGSQLYGSQPTSYDFHSVRRSPPRTDGSGPALTEEYYHRSHRVV